MSSAGTALLRLEKWWAKSSLSPILGGRLEISFTEHTLSLGPTPFRLNRGYLLVSDCLPVVRPRSPELRGTFGIHLARVAAQFKLDVEDRLASILPASDEE